MEGEASEGGEAPSVEEVAWARVQEHCEGVTTPAELLRRGLSHGERKREGEMAITRALTTLDHLKGERERIERQRHAAHQAAMQARGVTAATARLVAEEREAAKRLEELEAPRAAAEARLREVRARLRLVVASAADVVEARARGGEAWVPQDLRSRVQVQDCEAASDRELPLVLQATREALAAQRAEAAARVPSWGAAERPAAPHGALSQLRASMARRSSRARRPQRPASAKGPRPPPSALGARESAPQLGYRTFVQERATRGTMGYRPASAGPTRS